MDRETFDMGIAQIAGSIAVEMYRKDPCDPLDAIPAMAVKRATLIWAKAREKSIYVGRKLGRDL